MKPSTEPADYNLVFQGHTTGPATVVSYPVPAGEPMPSLKFAEDDRLNIQVLGPDGTSASMESVLVNFTVESGSALSPFGDGKKASFLWFAGEQFVHTVTSNGLWTFGAVLTAKDGTQYTLPDPEFQVGDGGGGGLGKKFAV